MNHYDRRYSNRYNDEPESQGCLSYLGGCLLVLAFMYIITKIILN